MRLNEAYTVMRGSILMMNPLPIMAQILFYHSPKGETKGARMNLESSSLSAISGSSNFRKGAQLKIMFTEVLLTILKIWTAILILLKLSTKQINSWTYRLHDSFPQNFRFITSDGQNSWKRYAQCWPRRKANMIIWWGC